MTSPSSSSPPTITFLDCPVDILHAVFQSSSPRDLYAVCLVCKALRALAEPFLYSRIHWTWLPSQTPPITLLLQTILSKPHLAVHVQSLVLDGDTFHRTEGAGRPPKIPVSGAELEEPIAFIEKVNVSYGDLWIQELRNGRMDAFVAVLLSQLPSLKYLRIAPNFAKDSQFVGMILRSALCESVDHGLPSFERLRDVSFKLKFDGFRGKYPRNTADVLPLFYLPNVQRLSASIDNPVTFGWPAKHTPTASTLTSLNLNFIREGHLGQILSATTGLKSLHWHWHYRKDLADRFLKPVIDLDLILEALFHVRDTLTDLSISATNYMTTVGWPPALTRTGSFNGIVDFILVKRFKAPIEFLMGFSPTVVCSLEHVIPKNVEFVEITDDLSLQDEEPAMDYSIVLGAVRSWLEHWRVSTPHLRSISFLLKYTYAEWDPAIRAELEELGTGVGIQVKIIDLEW